MRAGTSPWLSPKFNSVDVVKMMVEREEMRVKEWAREASWLVATVVLGPQCQKGVQSVRSSRGAHLELDSP